MPKYHVDVTRNYFASYSYDDIEADSAMEASQIAEDRSGNESSSLKWGGIQTNVRGIDNDETYQYSGG